MKTSLLLFFFTVINSSVIFSQKQIQFGLLFGLNKSQIIGDGYKGYHRLGMNTGVFSKIRIMRNSVLQFEVFYINKGCSSKRVNNDKNAHYGYFDMLHYVQIPILFNYSFKKYFFEIGPGLGLLVWNLDFESNPSKTLASPINFLEQNGNIGFGYTFNKNPCLGIRYTHSITPIRTVPANQYNSTFQLYLNYTLTSTKKQD